ncbi:MAG: LPS assembly lipoprotein LptE [Gemmatimonadetes bacterium]|nr:LPS assembly lipoprotein LptE [Gemmatimonadota bacterium]
MTPSGAVPDVRTRRVRRRVLPWLLALVASTSACYGFSGAGVLPKNLKSVNIEPFDNQTAAPELQREVFEQLTKTLRDRLNLREAVPARADVVVRGAIVSYDVDIPAGVSADARQTTSSRRRLQLVVDVEIIEVRTQRSLFKKQLSREGQYAEGGEANGRKIAIETIMNDIVEGVQSQW